MAANPLLLDTDAKPLHDEHAVPLVESPTTTHAPAGLAPPDKRNSTGTFDTLDALHTTLGLLHCDDLVPLARSRSRRTPSGEPAYGAIVYEDVKQWICFLASIWGDVLKSIGHVLDMGVYNIVVLVGIASAASVIMTALLPFCLIQKFPPVQWMYNTYTKWVLGDSISIVNALGHAFTELSDDQAEASKRALSAPPFLAPQGTATFDLDVAKLLLQLAALMYERGTVQTHAALRQAVRTSRHPTAPRPSRRPTAIPVLDFEPGELLAGLVGRDGVGRVEKLLHGEADGVISSWTRRHGIEYRAVSELNAESSAYAALFWPKRGGNWIVCAFKGTSLAEYNEWVWDFTYKFKYAGHHIPGFNNVHKGFFERLFPPKHHHHHDSTPRKNKSHPHGPYEIIASAIKLAAAHLGAGPDKKINVYFTGHSLGCGIASLAYARALAKDDFGPGVRIRDAYLFATPIVCDPESVRAFDEIVGRDAGLTRMMWRVTNGSDAVATMLPAFGDAPAATGVRFPASSPMNFAHLGAELRMRTKPAASVFRGTFVASTAEVKVRSEMEAAEVGVVRRGAGLRWWERALERVPLVGRVVQHGTSFYWDQLQRIGVGTCVYGE